LRILLAASPAAIAVALAYPAQAQDAPPPKPIPQIAQAQAGGVTTQQVDQPAPVVTDQTTTPSNTEENEIIVVANALRGAVKAPQPPVVELNQEDIASYGADSLADLISQLSTETSTGRGRGSGRPVFLVNGLRVSSFREMMSYPPEAIKRVQVLSEEVAQKYGFPPDQRVINFILQDNFASKTGEIEYGQPFRGDTSTVGFEGTTLNIAGNNRLNFDLKLNHTSPLTEAERGVIQTFPPSFPTDPDPGAFRTLVPKSSDYQLTGNWTKGLGSAGASLTLNGTAERSDSRSLSGLNTVDLTGPAPDDETVLRTFGADFPLATNTRTDTFSFGSTLNAHAGQWQLTGTLDASHADSTTKIDRRITPGNNADLQDLIDQAAAGTFALDGPITGLAYPGFDTAESKSDSATTKFTAMGNPIHLPAGDVSVTLDAGFDWNRIDSTDTRVATTRTKLTRGNLNGGVNVSVPLTGQDFGGVIGKLTANFSGGLDHLSDFGTLKNWSAGLNWGPTDKLNFQASYIVRDAAPGLSQLGAPSIVNFNVPVFDFTTGQTVLANVTTGGNPNLRRERDRDLHLGASYTLPIFDRASLRVEYFSNNSDNVTASFPLLTPEIEAAFPGRVTRVGGTITSIDERPVTFYNEKSSRLRFGIFLGGRIGSSSQQGGGGGGGRGGGGGGIAGGPGGDGGPPGGGGEAPAGAGGPPPGGGGFFFGGGQGGANGGRGNFNPQAFADFRAKLCDPKATTPPDLSALPEQLRARLTGADGKPDPQRLAEMKQRVCNGNGGFNPQAFAQLRQTFCPADKPLDASKLPAQVLDRFKGADGQVDQARLTQFRTRVCSIDPAQFAARQGQQGQQAQGGAQPGGQPASGNDQAGSGQGGERRGQNGGGARGGGGGGGPGAFLMNRGRNNGGRWNLSLSDTVELTNTVLIAPGGPLLDQLHGDAVSGNGVARNTLTLDGGVFYNGLGLRFNGSYKSGTNVKGTGLPGSTDLRFGSLFTLDLRAFADLGRQAKLVKAVPFFNNARISFSVKNVFDARQRVTDQNGDVPLRYQPFLIDPNGRTFQVEFRKMF
jgi:hypothetical protein